MAKPKTIQEKIDYYWYHYGIMICYDTGETWKRDRRTSRYIIKFPSYIFKEGHFEFWWKPTNDYSGVRGNEIDYYIQKMFFENKPSFFKEDLIKAWKG